jgi:hypothetical protein
MKADTDTQIKNGCINTTYYQGFLAIPTESNGFPL